MRPIVALATLFGFLAAARLANADVGDAESNYNPGRATRRSDFVAAASFGGVLGTASGYPNELTKLNDPRYEADTGVAAGAGGSAFIGGALRDWLVFGVGVTSATMGGNGLRSAGTAFIFHVEGYPLFAYGGPFQDLGVFGEFGAGGRSIQRDGAAAAEGGFLSVVSLGAVYEALRLGSHLSAGPVLQLSHQWSQSLTADIVVGGLRLAFYGGPG